MNYNESGDDKWYNTYRIESDIDNCWFWPRAKYDCSKEGYYLKIIDKTTNKCLSETKILHEFASKSIGITWSSSYSVVNDIYEQNLQILVINETRMDCSILEYTVKWKLNPLRFLSINLQGLKRILFTWKIPLNIKFTSLYS